MPSLLLWKTHVKIPYKHEVITCQHPDQLGPQHAPGGKTGHSTVLCLQPQQWLPALQQQREQSKLIWAPGNPSGEEGRAGVGLKWQPCIWTGRTGGVKWWRVWGASGRQMPWPLEGVVLRVELPYCKALLKAPYLNSFNYFSASCGKHASLHLIKILWEKKSDS